MSKKAKPKIIVPAFVKGVKDEAYDELIAKLRTKIKGLEIQLRPYEEDSAELLEKHGVDPDDKVDREDLKRMLNYLIGKNKRLKEQVEYWQNAYKERGGKIVDKSQALKAKENGKDARPENSS